MLKRILFLVVSSITLFAAGQPSLVEVTKLQKGEVNPLQEFIGTLQFDRSSVLAAQNSGLIKSISFELGDKVKKGQKLVQIDTDLLNAQIRAAKANLKSAKDTLQNSSKDYERYKKLLQSNTITQKEYDDALLSKNSSSSSVKALEANLKELQIQAFKKSIKAPYSGTIVEKNVNLGEWVNAGSPIAKIVDTSKIELTFNIPLNVFNGLRKGGEYEILIGENIVKAKLTAAIPSGDKLTRTFPVKFKADIKDLFVFDGQEAKVSLSKNAKTEGLLVPRDSVIKRFGQNVVFFIDKKMTAQMIPVQVVGYVDSKVAIAGKGLNAGMDIVYKGNERVFPNSPVKVINKK